MFAVILSALFPYRARHRHYLTRLYEEAKREAERAQEFATFLLAATGHDIRQPVYALDLNATLLEEQIEKRDWENAQKFSREQRDMLRNVARMLSSVLELSYLDRDRGRVEGEDVATVALFNSVRSAFQDVAVSRNITLKIVESSAVVRVDQGIVEHILTNLVANAIYHSGGDRILVGARAGAEQIEILVADNGKGLGSAPLHMTGQSLQKLVQDPSRRHSGLGLEIIFRLAEKGGLVLSLDAEPGRGVVARLICPRAGLAG
ncbi:HAMP domain-containing sensor histidine kinase [Maricaulis sp.]|uniref:sensor histidine kinase n=1 Tax=Maricaulis sp. TaxID=1486257 RepID=UPI001B057E7D|nr:HAMP domain-containing sensor histidine kinase [Maricaulis sp.]MBO6795922.1 HAMP domain-containing histidine kinase [Maricaulis sp.]